MRLRSCLGSASNNRDDDVDGSGDTAETRGQQSDRPVSELWPGENAREAKGAYAHQPRPVIARRMRSHQTE